MHVFLWYSSQESPWAWACRTGRGCVKVAKDSPVEQGDDMSNPTLSGCKLTCNTESVLWPKPRDAISLSKTLVAFHPTDIRISRISAPNSEVLTRLPSMRFNFKNRNDFFSILRLNRWQMKRFLSSETSSARVFRRRFEVASKQQEISSGRKLRFKFPSYLVRQGLKWLPKSLTIYT